MIKVGDIVDAIDRSNTKKYGENREEIRKFLIKSKKDCGVIIKLPMIVKSITPCDSRQEYDNCPDCPGNINGECYGYSGMMIETINERQWDEESNL